MQTRTCFLAVLLSVIFFVAGCRQPHEMSICPGSGSASGSGSAPEKTATTSSALVNGTEDPTDLFAAVACVGGGYDLVNGDTGPCASGTLIAPHFILTARHLGPVPEGSYRAVLFGAQARTNPIERAKAIRCWEFRNSGPAECCTHVSPLEGTTAYSAYLLTCSQPLAPNDYLISDLAVWQLDHDITDIQPIPVALTTPSGGYDSSEFYDMPATEVGFGSYDGNACAGIQAQTKSGVRRYGPTIVGGATYYDGDWAFLEGDGATTASPAVSMISATMDSNKTNTAPGDSGGPLLVNYGNSGADNNCVNVSDLRVIATAFRGCNYSYSLTTFEQVSKGLKVILE